MWRDWQPDAVQEELQKMRELGFNICRSFLFMPDFIPSGLRVEPGALRKLDHFLDLCESAGIGTILSFFVGHMSGEDWNVVWRGDRSFFSDIEIRQKQKMYVRTVVEQVRLHPALEGWILSNEIPNFENRGSAAEVANWAADIIQTIRDLDEVHPVSIGDGCWSPEVSRRLKNFQLRKLAPLQDFLGLHFYPRHEDVWMQSFTAAFRLNLAQFWGKPVIIEEFGLSTAMTSENNQADYYRNVAYSSLINGAQGILNWCFSDFECADIRPYSHHPHELRFGILDSNHRLKPAAEEMKNIAVLANQLASEAWIPVKTVEPGLLIPSVYWTDYPYDWDNDFEEWYPLYLNVFALIKRSGFSPRSILEPGIDLDADTATHELPRPLSDFPVLFAPRLKRLTAPFWNELRDYVQGGGALYCSFAHDAWLPDWEDFLGIQSNVRFGEPCYPSSQQLRLTSRSDWGGFTAGEEFQTGPIPQTVETAVCPVKECRGEVLVTDQDNRPVLISGSFGDGRIFWSALPVEMMLLHSRDMILEKYILKLYQSICRIEGGKPPVEFHASDMEYGLWHHPSEHKLKLAVQNHAWKERTGRLDFTDRVSIREKTVGAKQISEHSIELCLPSKGAVVTELDIIR